MQNRTKYRKMKVVFLSTALIFAQHLRILMLPYSWMWMGALFVFIYNIPYGSSCHQSVKALGTTFNNSTPAKGDHVAHNLRYIKSKRYGGKGVCFFIHFDFVPKVCNLEINSYAAGG